MIHKESSESPSYSDVALSGIWELMMLHIHHHDIRTINAKTEYTSLPANPSILFHCQRKHWSFDWIFYRLDLFFCCLWLLLLHSNFSPPIYLRGGISFVPPIRTHLGIHNGKFSIKIVVACITYIRRTTSSTRTDETTPLQRWWCCKSSDCKLRSEMIQWLV